MVLISIGAKCKNCGREWELKGEFASQNLVAFATLCDCGEVFAGNYKSKSRILTNGAFILINEKLMVGLPILDLE